MTDDVSGISKENLQILRKAFLFEYLLEDDEAMMKDRLAEFFKKTGAFKRGHFILASGKESNVYVDCRLATLDSLALEEISRQLLRLMYDKLGYLPTYIGGVTSGADPIVAGTLLTGALMGVEMQGFFVRKEAKGHGTKKQIEGHCSAESIVVVFDDVATTGGSSQIAVDAVNAAGAKVAAVCVIVDREEGAKQRFAEQGIPLYSLLTLKELEARLQ